MRELQCGGGAVCGRCGLGKLQELWCGVVLVLESRGVREPWCGRVVVRKRHSVREFCCGGVLLWWSLVVGELHFRGIAVWGSCGVRMDVGDGTLGMSADIPGHRS